MVKYLSEQEAKKRYEEICQKNMGISAEEFVARWDSGEFDGVDWDSVDGLLRCAMAIPLWRD